jgi:hypothetical protein
MTGPSIPPGFSLAPQHARVRAREVRAVANAKREPWEGLGSVWDIGVPWMMEMLKSAKARDGE